MDVSTSGFTYLYSQESSFLANVFAVILEIGGHISPLAMHVSVVLSGYVYIDIHVIGNYFAFRSPL